MPQIVRPKLKGKADRGTDRGTDRRTDRGTDIRRDRQAGKQTDNFLIRSQATVGSGNNVDDFGATLPGR